jgi:hypothetical protein
MTEPGKSSPPSQPKQTDASDASGAASASLADRRRKASVFQIETLSFPVGLWGIVGLLLYMLAFGFTATYTLVKIWPADSLRASADTTPDTTRADTLSDTVRATALRPAPAPADTAATADTSRPGGCRAYDPCADTVVVFQAGSVLPGLSFDFRPPRQGRRLLFIAMLAGGAGAFLSSLLSLATYIGNRELTRSWAVWYLARPPAGMVLALLVYFILRGGLLNSGVSVDVLSPYGVAAFSGLIGMFVRQASDKLRDVAEAMFTSRVNQERADAVHTAAAAPGAPSTAPTSAEAIAAAHVQDPGA